MKKFKVGLQLYSVNKNLAEDFYGTLKAVKEMGYDYVEFAGYFDHSAEEIKSMLDELGLTCFSVHQLIDWYFKEGEKAAQFVKTLGAKYSAIPWYNAENLNEETFDETVKTFTKAAELLKKYDIQLTYHNHDFEFKKYGDKFVLEAIYDALPDLLEGELDTCWAKYAGIDPVEFLKKYPGRMHTLHLKDFTCKELAAGPIYALIDEKGNEIPPISRKDNGFRFTPLGQGLQDFPAILKAAEEVGTEYVIVEQDNSYDVDPLVNAKISREYLKSLGI